MPLLINLRHLEDKDVQLAGELPVSELELDNKDEVVQAGKPLRYDLTAQKLGSQILVRGSLSLPLDCECVRCLKPVEYVIDLPDWVCDLPLEGEEKVPITNDSVDLTPYIREDILLEFPQHPLCENDCAGLPKRSDETAKQKGASQTENASAWSELNKLKF